MWRRVICTMCVVCGPYNCRINYRASRIWGLKPRRIKSRSGKCCEVRERLLKGHPSSHDVANVPKNSSQTVGYVFDTFWARSRRGQGERKKKKRIDTQPWGQPRALREQSVPYSKQGWKCFHSGILPGAASWGPQIHNSAIVPHSDGERHIGTVMESAELNQESLSGELALLRTPPEGCRPTQTESFPRVQVLSHVISRPILVAGTLEHGYLPAMDRQTKFIVVTGPSTKREIHLHLKLGRDELKPATIRRQVGQVISPHWWK